MTFHRKNAFLKSVFIGFFGGIFTTHRLLTDIIDCFENNKCKYIPISLVNIGSILSGKFSKKTKEMYHEDWCLKLVVYQM